jgi:WS/DGAT/MGAT family acyltransferase
MQQLSGLDAAFLAMENSSVTGHVGSLILLEAGDTPATIDLDRLIRLITERLPFVPVLRKRLVEVPLGLDQPYWVDEPDFDVEFHVRELALPAPGDDRQLCEQVARLHSRALDRARPMWEMYLISGLAGGRTAVYTKVHHAAIDGAAGAELLTQLLDLAPQGRQLPEAPAYTPEPAPGALSLLLRAAATVGGHPRRAARLALDLIRAVPAAAGLAAPLLRQAIGGGERDGEVIATAGPAPATRFNRPITPHRRFAFRSLSLDEVKEVKNAFGVTVNDVFVAVCAGALRRYLDGHGELPAPPLVAMMPVALSKPGRGDAPGNRVSTMYAAIPTHLADPAERIGMAHASTQVAKAQYATLPPGLIDDVTSFFAPALAARGARVSAAAGLFSRLHPFNVVLSNVPGAAVPVYLAGHRLLAVYPVSVITEGVGLNITVQSYHGGMHFGLITCRELVPDLDDLAELIVAEFTDLLALARRRASGTTPDAAVDKGAPARTSQ